MRARVIRVLIADSPKSFTTFVRKNPYRDSNEPSTPPLSSPIPFTRHKNETSSTFWPFRNHVDQGECDSNEFYELDTDQKVSNLPNSQKSQQNVARPVEQDEVRGRRPVTPTACLPQFNLDPSCSFSKTPPPRSRSPVKKLVGMVKNMSVNQIPIEPSPPKTQTPTSTSKRKWKEFGHKLRHGFLTPDLEQLAQEDLMEQYTQPNDSRGAEHEITPPSTNERTAFPVSIKSSGQSKLWSELEYMLIETCNTFLKDELEGDRLSRDSILRTKRQWQARNRPQVIEFYYDQATQYDLVFANLPTVKLYSDYSQDAIMLKSVLHQWKVLIRELSAKTLCMPDSIVRRWLHDGRRVLELLGASQITLANMDKLTSLCMAVIGSAEKERAKTRVKNKITDTQGSHRRSVSDSSTTTLHKHERELMRGMENFLPLPTPMFQRGAETMKRQAREAQQQQQQQHSFISRYDQRNGTSAQANQYGIAHGHVPVYKHKYGHSHSRSLTPAIERFRFSYE